MGGWPPRPLKPPRSVGSASNQFHHGGLLTGKGIRFTADAPAQAGADTYVVRDDGGSLYQNVPTGEAHEFRVNGSKFLEVNGTGVNFNSLISYGFKKAGTRPALSAMQDGEIRLGDIGSSATHGKIWIRISSSEGYEFDSAARFTT